MTLCLTRATDPVSTDFDNANGRISGFFNTVASGATNKTGAYISGSMDRTTDHCGTEFYEVGSGPGFFTGPPVATRTFTLPAPYTGAKPLPQQLAACISFHADLTGVSEHGPGGTRPAARRRGRVYFGPLNDIALQEGSGGIGAQTIATVVFTDLAKAFGVLKTNLATDNWTLSVFSRVDGLAYQVVGGYCDDAWDVQRRRKQITTGRVTF